MVPRRQPRPVVGLPRRVKGASQCAMTADRRQIASRLDDPVQVETMTPQQVRRVRTAGSVSALANDPHTAGSDPDGLAWSAICCTVWHGAITGAHPCTLIYLIVVWRLCWSVQRPARRWYLVSVYAVQAL